MKKLSARRYFLKRTLDYFGIGILIVLLLFMWTLYRGPISVPYLKPYIVEALNYDEKEYNVAIGEVNIELVRSIQPIRVTAKNISLKKMDGTISVAAPKLYLSFSLRALLKGIIAPSDITLKEPSLYIFTSYGGSANESVGQINKKKLQFYVEQIKEFLRHYNSADKIYPESYVNNIKIDEGEVEFHEVDFGRKWILSDLNFEFNRKLINININANALININDKIASAGFESEYHAANDKLDLEIYFSDLVLSDFLSTFNETTEDNLFSMMKIEVPVNGKINTAIQLSEVLDNPQQAENYLETAIENINFEIDGGHGYIAFNDDEKYNYEIEEMLLAGRIDGGIDEILIKDAELKMGGQTAKVGFQANGLADYYLERNIEGVNVKLTVDVDKFSLNELSRFWPRYLAEPAWQWCKDGLTGGMIEDANFRFSFGYDNKASHWGLTELSGKGKLQDGDLHYLDGMPYVHNIYGTAYFSERNIVIDIDKGVSDNVIVNKGKVDIYDLDKDKNYITIDLQGQANVEDMLEFIDNKPLNLASSMGMDKKGIKGEVDAKLKMNFELKKGLNVDEIKVDVDADLKNLSSETLIENHKVSADNLKLKVDGNGWNLYGNANFGDIPLELQIKENFTEKKYKSKCNVSFVLDDKVKKALGIDWKILRAPNIEGFATVTADIIVQNDGSIDMKLKADLKNIGIDYPYFGFEKAAGLPAEALVNLVMQKDKVTSVSDIRLTKSDFDIKAKADMYPSGRVKLINIYNINGPKTQAQVKINLSDSATPWIKVDVSGSSYNLKSLFDKADKKGKGSDSTPVQENEDDGLEDVNSSSIFITVGSLWTNDTTPIQNFSGSAKLKHGIGIDELHMAGNYGKDKSIKLNLDYVPRGTNEHYLSIDSNNAGSTLKVLHLYDNMVGGTLKIEARRDVNKKFIGHATVRDFSIQNAPIMAQLLSVASLTGILDLLKGDGLTFTHFNAPFEYHYKILKLNHAKAEGNVVGITTTGTYNRATEYVEMQGVIAPAYSINRFLGKIPVVGDLLASKDGTIFAADYKIVGKAEDADVDINSLSLLSPNSMKEWYNNNFGDGNGL